MAESEPRLYVLVRHLVEEKCTALEYEDAFRVLLRHDLVAIQVPAGTLPAR